MHRNARVSFEQKVKLLEFMQANEDLGRGKILGPDAARKKKVLIEDLSKTLNSLGSGSTKTPKKWLKCWHDWKSDTKSKALRIKQYRSEADGDPGPRPLSKLEEKVIQFWGVEMVQGSAVKGALEESAAITSVRTSASPVASTSQLEEEVASVPTSASDTEPPQSSQELHTRRRGRKRPRDDPLLKVLERQAAAIESMAAGMHEMATSVASTTAALMAIASAIEHQPRIVFSDER